MNNDTSALIHMRSGDNVAVAIRLLKAGEQIGHLAIQEVIPRGHKVAMAHVKKGEPLRKYGAQIGVADHDIRPGFHVHSHNLKFSATQNDAPVGSHYQPTHLVEIDEQRHFMGYRRASGAVGTRNYIAVLSSVNCSATVAKLIAQRFPSEVLDEFPNVDGVAAFVHGTGCGLDKDGTGFEILQRTLWGYARNPNVCGVLMVGLGCEVNQISFLLEAYGIERGPLFRTMTIQGSGGTLASIEKGISIVQDMLPVANATRREEVSASHLRLGLQCGGSDSWSGLGANPALGYASDLLVQQGACVVLSETPEIYGAEHLLLMRAASQKVATKLTKRIAWWEDYTHRNYGSMDNNPSPGNKAGGLTNILEKSLGAVAKSGSSGLMDVYEYAEQVQSAGLVFMDTPGYDPVSVTGQIAGGCNLIAFTTGRGSAFGSKPAPTIKISSNSALFANMGDDIDLDCGKIIDGNSTVEQCGSEIFETLLKVASGEKSKSEKLGLGDLEFVPWQVGAVM